MQLAAPTRSWRLFNAPGRKVWPLLSRLTTKEVLSSMNSESPKGLAPHENSAINSVIEAAKFVPGSMVEANTGEGLVRVSMGKGWRIPSMTPLNADMVLAANGNASNGLGFDYVLLDADFQPRQWFLA